jgi:hypothetical protein
MVPIVHVQQRLAQYFMHHLSNANKETTGKKQQHTKSVDHNTPTTHHPPHPRTTK